jgi:cold shock protein
MDEDEGETSCGGDNPLKHAMDWQVLARRQACLAGDSERACAMAQEGTVKFFKTDKGYGFIKPDDGQADIFVHITAVERAGLKSLSQGQRISFEVEPDKKGKGPKAVELTLL